MSTVTEAQPKLLNESDVAEILGVCNRTVWQLRKEGKIRAVKVGSLIRYKREEVDRFIDAQMNA